MATRKKALTLLRWVQQHDLVGMDDPESNYRNIRNCLIGQALADPEHPSLPIISSAIYCCLAQRLGMDAACCPFPRHVHAAVFAPPGETLDGKPRPPGATEPQGMYLDPYGSDGEITVRELQRRLVEFGWDNNERFLSPSPTTAIIERTAQNIKATAARALQLNEPGPHPVKWLRRGDPDLNMEAAAYAAIWSNLFTTPTDSLAWEGILEAFLPRFVQSYSEDAWLVDRYLVPLYDRYVSSNDHGVLLTGWQDARAALTMVYNVDVRPPTVNRRYTQDIRRRVLYRIGQVFRHRRYDYIGIINGWAPNDMSGLPTPHNVFLDEAVAPNGSAIGTGPPSNPPYQKRTYYTCL